MKVLLERTEECDLQNLVTSKTTRMQKVIDREGGMTRYKYCYVFKLKYTLLKLFDRLSSLISSPQKVQKFYFYINSCQTKSITGKKLFNFLYRPRLLAGTVHTPDSLKYFYHLSVK